MFHASEENKLYNFTKGTQTEICLKDGKEDIDLNVFLDDISIWMEDHKHVISSKYLPFSCLAVGLVPSQASAFVYGCFVGRAMEKGNVTVGAKEGPIDKNEMAHTIKEDIESQMGWLKNMLKQINSMEKEDDKHDKV